MFRFLSILICGCCIVADAQVSSNWFQKGSAIDLDNASSFDMSFSGDGNSIALVGASSSDAHAKVYSLQPTYDVTFSASEGGSINIPNGSYPLGTNITLSVTPDSAAWLFTGWSGDFIGDHTTSNATITITTNMSITANFSLDADGDGLSNLYELSTSLTDPYNADSDDDGLSDGIEVNISSTDPNIADFDGDELDDGQEISYNFISNSVYSVISSNSLTWQQAKEDAVSRGGHLATITSQEEWEQIKALSSSGWTGRWYVGGNDIQNEGVWEWVTGEAWIFDDWHPDNPDNYSSPSGLGEDVLEVNLVSNNFYWNDIQGTEGSNLPNGYILESYDISTNLTYLTDPNDVDSDDDGLTDGYEVNVSSTDPNDADSDGDGLLDFSELNGKIYSIIEPGSTDWEVARLDAISRGGYLATITSSNEWDVVKGLCVSFNSNRTDRASCWIGGTDQNNEGQWEWITGEEWTVDFWYPGEPNNSKPDNYAGILFDNYLWNDYPVSDSHNWAYVLEEDTYITNPNNSDSDDDGLSDLEEVQGKYIIYHNTTWANALLYAESIGAELAIVRNANQFNAVSNFISNADLSELSNSYLWLGGSYIDNQWRWVDGSLIDIDSLPSEHRLSATPSAKLTIAASVVTAGPDYKFLEFKSDNEQPRSALLHFPSTDPNNSDSDDDGLVDGDEINIYETDPLVNADKDGDGISDADEVTAGTDLDDNNDPIILPIISSFYSSSGTINLLTSIPSRQITYSVTATDNTGISSISIPGATQVSQIGDTYTFSETFNYNDHLFGNTAVTRTATVTDNAGNVATDSITLSINKIDNQPPSISLNADDTTIELSTSEQTQTIIYSVTATDNTGISNVSIPGATQVSQNGDTYTFTETFNYSDFPYGNTAVTRTVNVADNSGNVATDSITLSIAKIDNQPPSISLNADDTTIELRISEQTKTIVYTVTATDNVGVSSVSIPGISQGIQNGDTYTFSETFNYSDFPYGSTALSRTVNVIDNAGTSSSQTITITINRINNPPVFTSTNVFSVIENNNYIGALNATDPEGGSVTYNIVETNSISLSLDSATGVLTFEILPDYEQDATNYVCVFSAVDDYGLSSFTTNIINIIDDRTEDFDGDGLTEAEEEDVYGTSDLLSDTDNDGLPDSFEVNTSSTNPNNSDSDDDSLTDGEEVILKKFSLIDTENLVDFETARSDAENRGGQLAIIRNKHEFLYLCNWLDSFTSKTLWIGGYFDGTWKWVDGTPWTLGYINPLLEPNGGQFAVNLQSHRNLLDNSVWYAQSNLRHVDDWPENYTWHWDSQFEYVNYSGYLMEKDYNDDDNYTIITDPNNPDSDGDGLPDGYEVNTSSTNPNNSDSDDDGFNDGDEINIYETTPLDPNSYPVWNVNISVNGEGNITPSSGTYKRGTNITFTATEGTGYLFTGWYGDVLSDPINMSLSTNILISTNLNIVGAFSDDADGDGLTNTEENALGSSPWLLDSDGDGIDDSTETTMTNMVFTFNPTLNSQGEIDRFRDMLENIPGMNDNSMMDLRGGDIELSIDNNIATIRIPLQASTDGGNNWVDTTNVIETTYSATNSSGFFEMEFE